MDLQAGVRAQRLKEHSEKAGLNRNKNEEGEVEILYRRSSELRKSCCSGNGCVNSVLGI